MHQATHSGSAWKSLYWVGGVAALLAAIVFRRNLSAEFSLLRMTGVFSAGPTAAPTATVDWFSLLQSNALIGLTYLDLFDLVNYMLVGLIYLALYPALRQINAGWMTLATVLGLMGVVVYLAANQAFAMLTLSDRYAAATEAQRVLFVAAGEALLAAYQGSGIPMSLLLVTLGGLIIAIMMRHSSVFRGATAYIGIAAQGIMLCYFIALAFAPALLFLSPTLSAPLLLVWYILIGLRLLRLARGAPADEGNTR